MKIKFMIFISLLLLGSCKNASNSGNDINPRLTIDIAHEFINAFYSFNKDSLKTTLFYAKESQPGILYYQKWAECGNYKVIMQHDCIIKNDSLVICPVTVKDDLIGTLGIDFHVTDTFSLTIVEGHIRSVETSSNDPDLYYEAKDWIARNRPELIEKPCEGIWEGGPTPCECVQAILEGFAEFKTHNPNKY
jgi:hypothetical protein